MDVEFEEMKELVSYEIDCTVDVFFHAEEEFERSTRFVARWERNIHELSS